MAIAGFKVQIFSSSNELAAYVTSGPVTTIYAIIYSLDGKYLLFFA